MIMRSSFLAVLLMLESGYSSAQLALGSMAPEIKLDAIYNKVDDRIPTLAGLRGKIVLVDFWATWCGPCIASFPRYNALMEKYRDRDVHFIAITSEPKTRVENFLDRVKTNFWIGLDTSGKSFKDYEILTIPHVFLVNREGRIVFHGEVTEDHVDQVIATDRVEVDGLPDLPLEHEVITYGGFIPGQDPVYNGMYQMLGGDHATRPQPLDQFIIRPALDKDGGYGSREQHGHIGFTHCGSTLRQIITYLKELSTPIWITTALPDTVLYDLIYWRPKRDRESAVVEIISAFESALDMRLVGKDSLRTVGVLRLVGQGEAVVQWRDMPEGTNYLYHPASEFVRRLENLSAQLHTAGELPAEAMIFVGLEELNEFPNYDHARLVDFLARRNISVIPEQRMVTTYAMVPGRP
jgi:thiol-disulfide isomerase/thioredoxin